MNLYHRRSSQPLKWVVALLVFVVAMCFTMTDVYGNPPDGRIGGGKDQSNDGGNGSGGSLATNDNPDSCTAVPEPATLVLLAGGLGALYAARRFRKEK